MLFFLCEIECNIKIVKLIQTNVALPLVTTKTHVAKYFAVNVVTSIKEKIVFHTCAIYIYTHSVYKGQVDQNENR